MGRESCVPYETMCACMHGYYLVVSGALFSMQCAERCRSLVGATQHTITKMIWRIQSLSAPRLLVCFGFGLSMSNLRLASRRSLTSAVFWSWETSYPYEKIANTRSPDGMGFCHTYTHLYRHVGLIQFIQRTTRSRRLLQP